MQPSTVSRRSTGASGPSSSRERVHQYTSGLYWCTRMSSNFTLGWDADYPLGLPRIPHGVRFRGWCNR